MQRIKEKMVFLTNRKLLALLALIWLGVMFYLWFPQLIHTHGLKERDDMLRENGVHRAESFQMARFNTTKLVDIVHVCITSSEKTLGGMIALINSIDQNSKHPVSYHLVVDAESVEHLKTWISTSRLHDILYEVKAFPTEWVEGKIKVRGIRKELASPLNYARYYLPRLFPNLKGRILFIDDDSIVQGDVYELYQMTMKPAHWASFAEDCTSSAKRVTMMQNVYADFIDFKNKEVQMMDMSPTACSFNPGVYVTDLDLWRKNNITEKLEFWLELNTREEVYGNERGGGAAQPPMMIVFYEKYAEMDPSWHVRYLGWTRGTSYTSAFLKHAKLLHWNGQFKPWGRNTQHSEFWDRYFIKDPLGKFVPVRRN